MYSADSLLQEPGGPRGGVGLAWGTPSWIPSGQAVAARRYSVAEEGAEKETYISSFLILSLIREGVFRRMYGGQTAPAPPPGSDLQ